MLNIELQEFFGVNSSLNVYRIDMLWKSHRLVRNFSLQHLRKLRSLTVDYFDTAFGRFYFVAINGDSFKFVKILDALLLEYN